MKVLRGKPVPKTPSALALRIARGLTAKFPLVAVVSKEGGRHKIFVHAPEMVRERASSLQGAKELVPVHEEIQRIDGLLGHIARHYDRVQKGCNVSSTVYDAPHSEDRHASKFVKLTGSPVFGVITVDRRLPRKDEVVLVPTPLLFSPVPPKHR